MLLHTFLSENRADLIESCREKVAQRSPGAATRELRFGIAPFLDQLIKTLQLEQSAELLQSRKVSGPAGGQPAQSEIGGVASEHGRELLHYGYSIEEVVHDYGDLCQAITDLAFERDVPIGADEFRTLNRCLDNAIAVAVSEFAYQRDFQLADRHSDDQYRRLGFFAHEVRNLVTTATLAVNIMKSGNVGMNGATGQILDRSLVGLCSLIDRSLTEVRMASGPVVEPETFSLKRFVAELKVTASLEADVRKCIFIVADVDPQLALSGDRQLLLAAAGNLLQNAFKFTRPRTEVTLNAYSVGDFIHLDVEDNCGGLRHGDADTMFLPYVQLGADKTGVGLGLSISRRSVEANGGLLSVRDLPGCGCIFTIALPRHLDPSASTDSSERLAIV
jgi:signal transduction histidine kinase